MPIFVCDQCSCMDNTALGHYWSRMSEHTFKDKSLIGKALCSECAPAQWADGSKTGMGKWHNHFPKVQWDGKRDVINR